ncbi:arsenic resistance protein [Salisediminibacterium selenitireducens]|nr:bile acid:sodium symporter [Salisediminibacterium selenitireducens]
MQLIEKWYTLIIVTAVTAGLILGQWSKVASFAEQLIVPLLMGMLYVTFLQIPLQAIREALTNVRFTALSLILNFIWTPLLAWGLALVFLSGEPALYIGFIMLMVTPCTDWYLVFTGIAKGNTALSTAILPVNLLLQIVLLPVYLLLFGGMTGTVHLDPLLSGILFVLIIPFLLARMTDAVLKRHSAIRNRVMQTLSPMPILLLSLAICAMFASQGSLLLNNLYLLVLLLIPIILFFLVNLAVSQITGQKVGLAYPDRVSLSMTTLARNSPVALAIAITAFPDQPLIALTLVIGHLLELPILALVSKVLLVRKPSRTT